MKRKLNQCIRGFVLLLFGLFLVACDNGLTNPFVVSIEVDETTVASEIDMNEFAISDIKLQLNMSDGSTTKTQLTQAMLSEADLQKFATIGTHIITARYGTHLTTFTVVVKGTALQMQLRSIYNQAVAEALVTISYEEWLESIQGEDGVSIVNAVVNPEGYLILTLSNTQAINAGLVAGQNGTNGKDAVLRISEGFIQWQLQDDTNWNNLIALADLIGSAGLNGSDGIGILSITITDTGELIITQTNETETNLGSIIGSDGIGITSAVINELGHLIITYSNQETIDLGLVVGKDGLDSNNILLHVQDGVLLWKYENDLEWKALFSLSLLIGPQGVPGMDGLEVTMQVANGYIQWKYVGQTEWHNLIELSTLIGPVGPTGNPGPSGREVEIQVVAGYIQWKYSDELYNWRPLIALSDLIGPTGAAGTDGADGLEVIMQVASGYIQWKYEGDSFWNNLIEISTLIGPKGDSGRDLIMRVYNSNIEWQYVGDAVWNQLISLSTLVGPQGEPGVDGTEIILQVDNGFIQWKYEDGVVWNNLIEIATLVGEKGDTGASGQEVLLQVIDGYIKWKYTSDVIWTPLIELASLIGPKGEQGNPGEDGEAVLLQVQGGYIQWKYETDIEWTNLISIESLIGPTGAKGDTGDSGQQVIFQVGTRFIQWKYESDIDWNNLVSLESLTGQQGEPGLSAYQIYLILHPEYIKTESEWMYDLVNGLLGDRAMYGVTFNSMGGELPEGYETTILIEANSTINLPVPIKEGYTFEGWYTGLTVNDGKITNITPIQSNLILYAKWRVSDYFVIFFDHDGTFIKMVGAHESDGVTPPNDPSRVGYTFAGWSQEFNNITESKIIYAQYSINQYQLVYMLQSETPVTFVKLNINNNTGIALSDVGELYGWGQDTFGKFLGEMYKLYLSPTLLNSRFPLLENEIIMDISCSDSHCIVLTSLNRILTWGDNDCGELGDGTTLDSYNIIDITHQFNFQDDESIIMIDAKVRNTGILTSTGRLFIWGMNNYGNIGNGGGSNQLTPLDITSLFNLNLDEIIISIQFGYHNAGVLTNQGRVFMWGYNYFYSIGNGSEGFSYYPPNVNYPLDITDYIDLSESEYVTQLYVHYYHSHVVTNIGNIFGWGYNGYGQVGNGGTSTVTSPTKITSYFNLLEDEQIKSIEGSFHNYAITSQNRIFSWGNNDYGQLGDGTQINSSTPIDVTNYLLLEENEIVQFIQLGLNSTFLITNKDRLIAWGSNFYYNLGKGNGMNYLNPDINTQLFEYNLYQIDEENYGTTINYPTPSQEGYTFSGWYIDFYYITPTTHSTVPANHLYFYGKQTINQYEISFESNGGSAVTAIIQDYGTEVGEPINPTKDGHTFIGWYLDAALETPYVFTTMPATNLTLYAKWEINQYTMTFDTNGGSLIAPKVQDYGSFVERPQPPVLEGYYFLEWYVDAELLTFYNFSSFPFMPATDLTLYAKWQIGSFVIHFNSNGGSVVASISQTYGTIVTEPSIPTLDGHTFIGWYQDVELSTPYTFTTMPGTYLMLYAKWELTYFASEVVLMHETTFDHIVTLTEDGEVYTWGINTYGQLGNGTYTNSTMPQQITSQFNLEIGEEIVQVQASREFSVALTSYGRVFTWGKNNYGQLGNNTTVNSNTPIDVTSYFSLGVGETITDISGKSDFTVYALSSSNRLYVWGRNYYGSACQGSCVDYSLLTPLRIDTAFSLALDEVIEKVYTNNSAVYVLTSLHKVFGWGNNYWGNFGNGTDDSGYMCMSSPVNLTNTVTLIEDEVIVEVVPGAAISFFITSTGRIFGSGYNMEGQLGVGNTTWRISTKTEITSNFGFGVDENISSFDIGNGYSVLLTNIGRVFVWGSGHAGRLGTGNETHVLSPVDITHLFDLEVGDYIKSIHVGNTQTHAYSTNGRVFVWGSNTTGLFGDGTTISSLSVKEIR